MTRKYKILFLVTPIIVALGVFILFKSSTKAFIDPKLPVYTAGELVKYNGDNPNLPVYIAMDGLVYDVSLGRGDFYDPGRSYHYLAGRDSSSELDLFGGKIIKRKYKVVGRYSP